MNLYRITPAIIGLLLSVTASAETALTTEKNKLSYGLGMMIGERLLKQYGDVDYQIILEAMTAQHQGKKTLMSMEDAGQTLGQYHQQQAAAKFAEVIDKGEKFLKTNAEQEGVTVTESGLQYSVITAAEGDKPKATDSVTVHYRGTLLDGTEFDSSYSRGEPATFGLNQVIAGWTEGVQLMNTGSKYKFVIPSQLAYGERGAGSLIGPHETLIFEVELISIN